MFWNHGGSRSEREKWYSDITGQQSRFYPSEGSLRGVPLHSQTQFLAELDRNLAGCLVRKLLKRRSFASIEELEARVLAFIGYYNQTSKPLPWSYQRKPATI